MKKEILFRTIEGLSTVVGWVCFVALEVRHITKALVRRELYNVSDILD